MNQKIYYNGSNYEEFKKIFLIFFDEENLQTALEIIDDYKEEILDTEEKFIIESEKENGEHYGYNKIIPKTYYHVNIKNITIVCLQILLEMIIQNVIKNGNINEQEIPIVPTFVELKKCFNKLHEENGEFCISKEIECSRTGFSGWNSFESNKGECINNHLSCLYNLCGQCELKKNEFEKILESLVERKIIRNHDNEYKITF